MPQLTPIQQEARAIVAELVTEAQWFTALTEAVADLSPTERQVLRRVTCTARNTREARRREREAAEMLES